MEAQRPAVRLPPYAARVAPAEAPFRGNGAMGSYRSTSDRAIAKESALLLRLALPPCHRDLDLGLRPSRPKGGRGGSDKVSSCARLRATRSGSHRGLSYQPIEFRGVLTGDLVHDVG